MSSHELLPLKWSAKYTLNDGVRAFRLKGDKILLPPSALEQLLSASTTASNDSNSILSASYSDYGYQSHSNYERSQDLPHPLMFRLVNPDSGNVVYAGIREFSAEEGEVEISPFLRNALGLQHAGEASDQKEAPTLTVHAQSLPKGSFVRFRPLEAGYDPEDWKALLEKHLRNTFTTLTKGEVLSIQNDEEQYRFLIDEIRPEGEGICVIDTDLEVDIEPLSEEQALETLKRREAKKVASAQSSAGGVCSPNEEQQGHVAANQFVDYTLSAWDRTKALNIELQTDDPTAVDLYVVPFSSRQRAKPRLETHLFEDISDRSRKRICIRSSNVELEGAEAILIGVSGYATTEESTNHVSRFTLSVRETTSACSEDEASGIDEQTASSGDVRCENCNQRVPSGRMFLHENFCLRNNIRCSKCGQVFQKASDAWTGHWHCEQDEAYGNSEASRTKHNQSVHTPVECAACGEALPDMMALARHRVTVCPEKEILCQFCHLLVPQKGPEDPDFSDPEVLLSGLTPHELSDGARTTECHLCNKIVRLRDMTTHLKHHDLERRSRPTPRLCRNINCGRTIDGVGPRGKIMQPRQDANDLNLCESCFGPLYSSSYDPEHKGLKRRVERKYLTQLVTGCGQSFCRNEFCKNGRYQLGLMDPGQSMSSKDAMLMTRPEVAILLDPSSSLHFCTDEASQKGRNLAETVAVEHGPDAQGVGYSLPWCVAAFEAEHGNMNEARTWLENWAPTRAEEK